MYTNLYAMIENTTLCGGNCIMCPRDSFSHKFENMSFDTFKKIVDELVAGGCRKIGIIGFGDSLCDVGLEDKLKYVRSICPEMLISTINTGHLCSEKNIDMICKYVDMIKISMYGYTKETYEAIHRGNLVFENIKRNIDNLLERCKESNVYTIMTFLMMEENAHEMEAWKKYYEPRCDRIDIWKPHNWGGGYGQETANILGACPRVMKCNDLQFCTDGSVVLCCFDYNRHDVVGNVNESTIEEILNGDAVRRMQHIHRSGKVMESDTMCKFCDQIRDRGDALIYSSDCNMSVGKASMERYDMS